MQKTVPVPFFFSDREVLKAINPNPENDEVPLPIKWKGMKHAETYFVASSWDAWVNFVRAILKKTGNPEKKGEMVFSFSYDGEKFVFSVHSKEIAKRLGEKTEIIASCPWQAYCTLVKKFLI